MNGRQHFGLQLVGYRNKDQGLKSVFTTISIRYSIINVGSRDMLLTGAFKTTPMVGMESLLPIGDTLQVDPGTSEIFSELLTLNLLAVVGIELTFNLLVQGEDAVTGLECGDTDAYILKIQPLNKPLPSLVRV